MIMPVLETFKDLALNLIKIIPDCLYFWFFKKKKKFNVHPFWEEVTDYTKVKVNSQMFIRSARY